MENDLESADNESREFKVYATAAIVCLLGVILVVVNGFTNQQSAAPNAPAAIPAIVNDLPKLPSIPTVPDPISDLSQSTSRVADVVEKGVGVVETGLDTGEKVMKKAANFVDDLLGGPPANSTPVNGQGNQNQ